jgi:hypothetical protein
MRGMSSMVISAAHKKNVIDADARSVLRSLVGQVLARKFVRICLDDEE